MFIGLKWRYKTVLIDRRSNHIFLKKIQKVVRNFKNIEVKINLPRKKKKGIIFLNTGSEHRATGTKYVMPFELFKWSI